MGRRSSHFTRLPLLLAQFLGVACRFVPVPDLKSLAAENYGGHPAMKLPVMRDGGQLVIGSLNICHALAMHAEADSASRIVWPEQVRDHLSRNAQELVWQAMTSQVQLVMGALCGLPADNLYFVKTRIGMFASLRWLDYHLPRLIEALPRDRHTSMLEMTLFCLVEHLRFRRTLDVASLPALLQFTEAFARRAPAVATAYRFDHELPA